MHLSKEVRIGIIAIIVLALTVWGYNFLKGKNILKPTDEYYIVFDRIDGLIEAGNVMFRGYKVGHIANIKYNSEAKRKFIVKIILEERIKLPVNSYIKVKQVNPLAATSDLEIILSDSQTFYVPGDTIGSIINKGFADVLVELQGKIENVLTGLDSTLVSVNNILTVDTEDKLRESITNLHSSLNSLNASLSKNGNLYNSFDNLEGITSNLKTKNNQISQTLDHLSNISEALDSADLKTTLQILDSTLLAAHSIMEKIDKGDGTIGKLVNDRSIYVNLDSTSYYLNILMKDLQEHPKRYVHFSVFGKKDK